MALRPSTATASAPCRVNGLIDHNVFYFLPWTAPLPCKLVLWDHLHGAAAVDGNRFGAVPCRVNGP